MEKFGVTFFGGFWMNGKPNVDLTLFFYHSHSLFVIVGLLVFSYDLKTREKFLKNDIKLSNMRKEG